MIDTSVVWVMRPSLEPDGDVVKRGVPPVEPPVDRRTFLKGAGAATVAASLAGCNNPAAGGGGNNASDGGGGQIPSEPLRMATIAFTSGPASVFGAPMMRAARMIVEQINDNSGILGERTIEMDEFDENTEDVAQQYRRLATQENYDIILGYVSSANALTVGPIAEELEIGRASCRERV